MKRDKAGKFIQMWDEEPKQAVKLSLTKTAWQILQQQACDRKMSRSELVEQYARSLQTVPSFAPATPTPEPANGEIEAQVASRTAQLRQANTQLQEKVAKLEQELQQQSQSQANQRQWLEAILNLLPTPLILSDRETGRVTFSNQAANQLGGTDISSDRLAGVYNEDYHCTDETGQIIPPDQLPSARAARGEKIHGMELNWHNPTGIYPLLVYAYTLPAMHERAPTSIVVFQDISKRKQMEAQLQESNRRITNILESITDAFIAVDRNWRITYVNQEAGRLNGKLPQELMGKDAWEEWAVLKGTQTEQEYRRAMTQGVPVHFEVYYAPLDLWVENHAYPSPDGLSIFFRDITQRKRAEQEIQTLNQELEQRVTELQTLLDVIPLGIAIAQDPQCQMIRVNPYLQRMLQVGATDNISLTNKDAVSLPFQYFQNGRELSGEELPMHVAAARGIDIRNCELQLVRSDGVSFDLLGHAIPLFDEQGVVRGCMGVYMDITERKQAEEALRQREACFRTVLDNFPDTIALYDAQQRLKFVNAKGIQLLGRPVEEILGRTDRELWPSEVTDSYIPLLERTVETRTTQTQECTITLPNLEPLSLIITYIPLLDTNGEIDEILGITYDITEQKRSQAALQQSEARLARLAENLPGAIYQYRQYPDGSDEFPYISSGCRELYGVEPWEIQQNSQRVWQTIHPYDLDALQNSFNPEVITGTQWRHEWRIINHQSGELKWLQGIARCEREPEGSVLWDGVLLDISDRIKDVTQRQQTERALHESEERFRTLADNIAQLAWMADEDGWIFWYNQRWFDYTGTTLKEMEGWGWQKVHHPEYLEQVVQKFRHCLESGDVWEDTFPLRSKDGDYRWFLSRALPIRDKQGKVFRWFGTNTDITERKLAEAALQQSEERYRYLAQLIPQVVWIANDEGVLLDVNQRWIEYTGLTLEQAQTEGWKAIVHPDDLPIVSHHWAMAQQNAIRYQAEGRIRRVDGAYRWYLHQALPLKNEQGQVVKWFGTATDIEEQKQLEQQRDRILQQEQKAREEAERANRIKDEFLAVLSHELRSPLNPILGWSRLLQTRKFDQARTTEALKVIERNAKLQSELIEDLLDVSRILRGKLSLNSTPIDLASTIRAAMETVRLAAQANSIQIQTSLEPNLGKVAGDSSRLQQVVWNLLSNAIKFTPPGGQVYIRLERVEGNRGDKGDKGDRGEISSPPSPSSSASPTSPAPYAQITVTDTGKGISPEFLPHVFDYFRQADSTTTRTFGGLGLGLAIVHHLVELHGGTVQADSLGEGQGATFTVRLPLLPTETEAHPETKQLEQLGNLNGIKVLVVDDEADSREFATFVLEQKGAIVTMASSASEALAALTQFQPDVLLSDIGMPDVDGYMLIKQIRALPPEQGGQIKAIALTAYAGEINYQQALSAGFQRHISKPVEPAELVAVVASLIQPSN